MVVVVVAGCFSTFSSLDVADRFYRRTLMANECVAAVLCVAARLLPM